jgi:hypothetical protein
MEKVKLYKQNIMAKIITCIVLHIDGITKVKAKGILKDGVFDGNYK